MNSAEEIIRAELEPGELLLWSGQPPRGVQFTTGDFRLIPLCLLCCYAGVETLLQVPGAVIVALPILLFGLYFGFVHRFLDAYMRKRTYYGISSERIIVAAGLWRRRTASLPFDMLLDVTLCERCKGAGTIACGGLPPRADAFGHPLGKEWQLRNVLTLDVESGAASVYALILDAQRRACIPPSLHIICEVPPRRESFTSKPTIRNVAVLATSDEIVQTELAGTEQLLWAGRARRGLMFTAQDFILIPVGVGFCGLASWLCFLSLMDAELRSLKALFAFVALIIGLYCAALRHLSDVRARNRTCYGVSSERILLITQSSVRIVRSVFLDAIFDLTLKENANGSGTIAFGPLPAEFGWMSGRGWVDPLGQDHATTFELALEARSVYGIIQTVSQTLQQRVLLGASRRA